MQTLKILFPLSIAALLMLPAARANQDGTYIAGVLMRVNQERGLAPVPAQQVLMVTSSHTGKDDQPERRLDEDVSDHEGRFVLGTNTVHPACTLLFYPYPRDPGKPTKYLPKAVYPVKDNRANIWRLKLKVVLTPTDVELVSAPQVQAAIEGVLLASRAAQALDIAQDTRQQLLKSDLLFVVALIPDEKRSEYLQSAFTEINRKLSENKGDMHTPEELVLKRMWSQYEGPIYAMLQMSDESIDAARKELNSIR